MVQLDKIMHRYTKKKALPEIEYIFIRFDIKKKMALCHLLFYGCLLFLWMFIMFYDEVEARVLFGKYICVGKLQKIKEFL